jgi:hypothetical protein
VRPASGDDDASVSVAPTRKEPTDREKRQAIDAAVKAKLHKEIDVDVIETPFSDVCKDIAKQLDVTLIFDPEGLEEAGVPADQLVNLRLNLRADAVLKILLSPLHLNYVVQDGLVLITSNEKYIEVYASTRVYDVRDLLTKDGLSSKPLPLPNKPGRIGPTAAITGSSGAVQGSPETPINLNPQTPADQLVALICETINPRSWTHRGGNGTANVFAGRLVVRHGDATLEEIGDLLEDMRRVGGEAKSK